MYQIFQIVCKKNLFNYIGRGLNSHGICHIVANSDIKRLY
jgi:hypothetical protein